MVRHNKIIDQILKFIINFRIYAKDYVAEKRLL